MAQYTHGVHSTIAILNTYVAELVFCNREHISPSDWYEVECAEIHQIITVLQSKHRFELFGRLHDAVQDLQGKKVSDFDSASIAFPSHLYLPGRKNNSQAPLISVFHLTALVGDHEYVVRQVTQHPSLIEGTQRAIHLYEAIERSLFHGEPDSQQQLK